MSLHCTLGVSVTTTWSSAALSLAISSPPAPPAPPAPPPSAVGATGGGAAAARLTLPMFSRYISTCSTRAL